MTASIKQAAPGSLSPPRGEAALAWLRYITPPDASCWRGSSSPHSETQRTPAMKVSPTEQEGLREQSSTSAAPGRKFKVNDHSVRIPLAVVKLMRQPVSASVQEVVPRL